MILQRGKVIMMQFPTFARMSPRDWLIKVSHGVLLKLKRSTRTLTMCVLPLLLVLSGCGDAPRKVLASASDAAAEFGLRQRVVVPVVVDVVLDPTLDAPGRVATWDATREVALPVVLSSMGFLRAWVVTPEGVVLVASFTPQPNTRPGTPARIAHEKAERSRAATVFQSVAVFLQRPAGARSPLFAALTTVVAETTPSNALRHTVLVSDGLVYDQVDWECLPITPLPALVRFLDREHYLLPGSMQQVRVHWTYFRTTRTPRCPGHAQVRQDDVTARWREVLQRAGATPTFSTGPITKDDLKGTE